MCFQRLTGCVRRRGGVNQRKTASGTPDAGCSITKYLKNPLGRRQHGDRASYHTEGHQKKQIVLRRAGRVFNGTPPPVNIFFMGLPHPSIFFYMGLPPTPIFFYMGLHPPTVMPKIRDARWTQNAVTRAALPRKCASRNGECTNGMLCLDNIPKKDVKRVGDQMTLCRVVARKMRFTYDDARRVLWYQKKT